MKTILNHSRDHKSHFKSKVRHIFERLIRKFSFEKLDAHFPEEDKKLILNIKKRRDALKKKSVARREESHDSSHGEKKKGKDFEEAFHDSGSELGTDDEGDEGYIPEQYQNESAPKKVLESFIIIDTTTSHDYDQRG